MSSFLNVDESMSQSRARKRLERLAKSGIHFCEDASTHAKELKELTGKTIKPETLKRQSRVFRALADETRLKILSLLRIREMCVCEIMVALDLTQPTASHHLKILENVGLVRNLRRGKWVFYKTTGPESAEEILKLNGG
jgi:ArsR family transcriptional regulator